MTPPKRARSRRALAFPRAFSIMAGELTGKVVDVLRVLSSNKTYRASAGDVTRRLIHKGMLVEAVEHATTYATGRPADLLTDLVDQVCTLMGGREFVAALPGHSPDEVLQAVLSRMWPDIVQACDPLDVRNPGDALKHRGLLAGPPLTRMGRAKTAQEIREEALSDIVSERAQAPEFLPPRDVQQAREQARLQTDADRLAMERGVSAADLLAGTSAGRAAGIESTDESAAARGYAPPPDHHKGPGTVAGKGEQQAIQPSVGEMLKRARGEL